MSNSSTEKSKLQWFEQLQSPLLHYSFGILRDSEEAKDLVQEAFLKFFNEEQKIHHPKAWLYSTTRNLSLSRLRKKNRMILDDGIRQLDLFSITDDYKEENPREQLEQKEKIYRVKHAVSQLPADSQNLLKMKFHKRMSYREISESLKISVGNVGYKLHQTIRDLAFELENEGVVE